MLSPEDAFRRVRFDSYWEILKYFFHKMKNEFGLEPPTSLLLRAKSCHCLLIEHNFCLKYNSEF